MLKRRNTGVNTQRIVHKTMEKNVVIDNGQYQVRFGTIEQENPFIVPNCIIRTQDKRIHLGSKLNNEKSMKDLAILSGGLSNISFQRPIKNGQCYQWNLEHQIWDNAFVDSKIDSGNGDFLIDSNLLYIESPIILPKFQNMADQILFEELGIGSLVRTSGPALAPWLNCNDNTDNNNIEKTNYKNFQLVIDSGFDATWIIPMVNGLPFYKAIRKLPIGGKFLNGYLREIVSFRHYNITEEPILVNSIKHKACYIATDFNEALNNLTILKKTPNKLMKSKYALTYVLPNNKNDFEGHVINDISKLSKAEYIKLQNSLTKKTHDDEINDDNLDDSNMMQSLLLTDERFMIPELLFHPQLAGVYKSGLIQTIKASLDAVPELLVPLLVNNIVCIGGTSNIKGFEDRIVKDLDSEVPIEARCNIIDYSNITNDKSLLAWHAGKKFFQHNGFDKVKLTRDEYNEFGAEYAQEKFGFKLV